MERLRRRLAAARRNPTETFTRADAALDTGASLLSVRIRRYATRVSMEDLANIVTLTINTAVRILSI